MLYRRGYDINNRDDNCYNFHPIITMRLSLPVCLDVAVMLKIDIDDFPLRSRLDLQRIMYALPRPYSVRLSSSGKGLHMKCPLCTEWSWYRCYDDPARVDLDDARIRAGLQIHNLLWDIKGGKKAGHWTPINTALNIEQFLDALKPLDLYGCYAYRRVVK
jgi:hypothetical protein